MATPATTTPPASPSRALRKRPPARPRLADDLDYDLERLLREHERLGAEQRAEKRRRAANAHANQRAKAADGAAADAESEDEAAARGPPAAEEEAKYAGAFAGYEIPFDALPALCVERIFGMVR